MLPGSILLSHRWSFPLAIAALTVAGFVLRMMGLRWDDGALFHPDEANLVRAAVQLAFPDRLIPDFHSYGQLSLVLPRLAAGWSSDPATVALAARVLSAFFAAAVIPVAAATSRIIGGPLAGVLAALLTAFCSPLIAWAHFGTTESALTLTVAVLLLLSVMHLDNRISVPAFTLWSGIIGGVGLSMKVSAGLFAVIPVVTLLLGSRLTAANVRWAIAGGSLALIIFLATNPAVLLATDDFWRAVTGEGGIVRGSIDVFWTWQFVGSADGVFQLRQLFGMLDGGVALCAFAGFAMFLWQRDDRAIPALVFVGIYAAVTFGWHAKFVRYLAPLIPIFLILAACFIAQCVERFRSATMSMVLTAAIALFALTGVTRAIGFIQPDPRHAAAAYVAARAINGEKVLIEAREVSSLRYEPAQGVPVTVPAEDRQALEALAETIAGADWLVLNSRRHWAVLSRLQDRFPAMCGYYLALFNGDFGLVPVRRFERNPPLSALLRPGLSAEETRVVFDRPTVHVFRRRDRKTPADIMRSIDESASGCRFPAVVEARELAP